MALVFKQGALPFYEQAKKRLTAKFANYRIGSTHSKQRTSLFPKGNKRRPFAIALLLFSALPAAFHAQSAAANNGRAQQEFDEAHRLDSTLDPPK